MIGGGNDARALAARIAAERQADVLLFRGQIARDGDGQLAPDRRRRPDRPNVLFILSTHGGSADTAYRVARTLQRSYERVTIVVDDYCKGAGTLLVLGADELVMSDFGELGPLDVHGGEPVQLGRMSSGLGPLQALDTLRAEVLDLVDDGVRRLREGGRQGISVRIAVERASELAIGLFSPIYAQIDPGTLGEVDRLVRTTREYARRIGRDALKDGALDRLVSDYPSHDFVIDRQEAESLFQYVRPPTPDEAALLTLVEPIMADRRNEGRFLYLDDALNAAPDTSSAEASGDSEQPSGDPERAAGGGGSERSAEDQAGGADAGGTRGAGEA